MFFVGEVFVFGAKRIRESNRAEGGIEKKICKTICYNWGMMVINKALLIIANLRCSLRTFDFLSLVGF